MNPNIGLNDSDRQGVVALLQTLLADEYVLYTRTRNYHWNVTGPQFNDLHKFFEAQYETLDDIVDEVAERARALGGGVGATLGEFVKGTRLKETPGRVPAALDMVGDLLADHETIIRQLRSDLEICAAKFHDAGTQDFLTGLMEQHEKMAWMLRSFQQGR